MSAKPHAISGLVAAFVTGAMGGPACGDGSRQTGATTGGDSSSTSTTSAIGSDTRARGTTSAALSTTVSTPDVPPADESETEGDSGTTGDACARGAVPNATRQATYDAIEHGWQRVERWQFDGTEFPDDPFFPDSRSEQTGQALEFFGRAPKPGPDTFLLEYGPGWERASGTPVLLVHGADDPPDRTWANPGEQGPYGCGDMRCPSEGLMQSIAAADIPVFAIAFPNTQGDNNVWAEQIHAAVQVVLTRTCAQEVDLVGWSKGAFAARLYASSYRERWATPYADQVRKLVLIGAPNLGLDYVFRHGSAKNTTVWPPGMTHGPTPHHEQLLGLQVIDQSQYAVYPTDVGDYFRGQAQMLANWSDTYPLVFVANNGLGPYPTVDTLSTYFGEGLYIGLTARGHGIEYAIEQASLVDNVVSAGVPAAVETFLLCSEITDQADYIVGIPNELSGPSDGIVFVESCAAPDGIGRLGDVRVISDINHLELGWAEPATQTVLDWLAR
ncbi:MAG: hypothetical protein JKY37_17695 [Nannocystaceae bacterium]|nr:hypothetical protein [Nannocystaceae bacterium]